MPTAKPVIVLIAMLLSACGGGGTDESCVPRVVRVQLFGDSTQRPQGPGVQAFMDARFGVGAVRVEVRAKDGTGTVHLLAGTDGVNLPWPQSVDADIVAINSGMRDMRADDPTGIDRYKANLRALTNAPARVLLETPNPAFARNRLPGYHQAVREVAAETGTPLADVDAYVRSMPGWEAHIPDGVHPDAELSARIVAGVLGPALAELVAPLRCE